MPTCLPACLLTPPPLAPVRTIAWSRPLVWLSRALQDISNAPLISLAHGLALILIGAAILTLGHNRFWLMAGALSGFLVVGPLVATSLYAVSRGSRTKAKVALFKGGLILVAAGLVALQIISRLVHPVLPAFDEMGLFSLLALAANSVCLFLLWQISTIQTLKS